MNKIFFFIIYGRNPFGRRLARPFCPSPAAILGHGMIVLFWFPWLPTAADHARHTALTRTRSTPPQSPYTSDYISKPFSVLHFYRSFNHCVRGYCVSCRLCFFSDFLVFSVSSLTYAGHVPVAVNDFADDVHGLRVKRTIFFFFAIKPELRVTAVAEHVGSGQRVSIRVTVGQFSVRQTPFVPSVSVENFCEVLGRPVVRVSPPPPPPPSPKPGYDSPEL